MKTISIKRRQAVASSCTAGQYFIRKMFLTYGRNGVIKLSLKLLKQMAQEFVKYHENTKSKDICYASPHVHYIRFFDLLLYNVERKDNLRDEYSDNWEEEKFSDLPTHIVNAFWRELKRVIK